MPKYLQISTWLRELIRSGRYKSGEKLPAEVELSKMCQVNRNTLRQAISDLVSQGILRKEKGFGTFVASSEPVAVKHRLKQISSFRDDLREIGIQEKTILLNTEVVETPSLVAERLVLGPGSRVVVVRRLRTGDGIPLIYEESHLPHDMFKGITDMDLTGSMYTIISRKFNTVLERSEQSIMAVNLNKKIARLLTLPENAPGIFMESITYNDSNIPIEVLYSYYRGDKYRFEIELGRYRLNGNGLNPFAVDP
jgi:GntR family transcriptional regulator